MVLLTYFSVGKLLRFRILCLFVYLINRVSVKLLFLPVFTEMPYKRLVYSTYILSAICFLCLRYSVGCTWLNSILKCNIFCKVCTIRMTNLAVPLLGRYAWKAPVNASGRAAAVSRHG